MKKELDHFYIGSSYGGNQEWFRSFMMRLGGCGAETACDSSLYFALHRGVEGIYPYDASQLTKKDYVGFAHIMEKYLWPRMSGIDRVDIFIDGYSKYLHDRGIDSISMSQLDGTEPYEAAARAIMHQIDAGLPVPTLILNHRDRAMSDYNWHWFLINGYDISDCETGEGQDDHAVHVPEAGSGQDDNAVQEPEAGSVAGMRVKAVTYSEYQWLDLRQLWDTGYVRRGGLVLFSEEVTADLYREL